MDGLAGVIAAVWSTRGAAWEMRLGSVIELSGGGMGQLKSLLGFGSRAGRQSKQ